jgi:hypothetical protein
MIADLLDKYFTTVVLAEHLQSQYLEGRDQENYGSKPSKAKS